MKRLEPSLNTAVFLPYKDTKEELRFLIKIA